MGNNIRVSVCARVVGAPKACWSLYKMPCVRVMPTVEEFSIHLEGDKIFLLGVSASTVLKTSESLAWFVSLETTNLQKNINFGLLEASRTVQDPFHIVHITIILRFSEISGLLQNIFPKKELPD